MPIERTFTDTPEQLEELVMQIRSITEQQGQVQEVLGALEWRAVAISIRWR